uniref:Ca3427-like PBP 2 domain-containing protein n=1 Tax=Chromera velia CCMP2878 TaxID=1169474 RepID=A0A0G4HFJ5_9ALVE|eukprot:Cvel_6622.t1-p1 / transcript=Cvel_6622.t1 / gene=Cvel_6622 / organism=Chromera_velia_CCMP2878 / gene_product=hypothetical protein / transcript_product=hypothetical protein / location=Cvel_scaffold328:18961-23528(+) / protein_length=372 / sequence_SO=supercontig / SO=protein_coding / is_pseudo=false
MLNLRFGGVPEHFNAPFQIALERGFFREAAIDFSWTDFPGGSGQMSKALEGDEVDVCCVLSEAGVLAATRAPSALCLVGTYVDSPLTWGIHVKTDSAYERPEDLQGKVFGISRWGSGSHLIAFVEARQRGWEPGEMRFLPVGDLEGARKSMQEGEIDGFLWEKFTTKHLTDSGEWRRIGNTVTPWPCFVVLARRTVADAHSAEIQTVLEITSRICEEIKRPSEFRQWTEFFSSRYGNSLEDAAEWLSGVKWRCQASVDSSLVSQCSQYLREVGVLPQGDGNGVPEGEGDRVSVVHSLAFPARPSSDSISTEAVAEDCSGATGSSSFVAQTAEEPTNTQGVSEKAPGKDGGKKSEGSQPVSSLAKQTEETSAS